MVQLSPIAIAATSQEYLVNITEKLCQPICSDGAKNITGGVNFSVVSVNNNNTQTIVTINAAVTFVYTPVRGCKSIVKQKSEQFQVAFIGAANTTPTIALSQITTQFDTTKEKCCNQSYGVTVSTPLTITATYPA